MTGSSDKCVDKQQPNDCLLLTNVRKKTPESFIFCLFLSTQIGKPHPSPFIKTYHLIINLG